VSEPIISVSGLRGIVGQSFTPLVVARYVAAFAHLAPPGTLVVGRDGRHGGEIFASLVCQTLAACGRRVQCADVLATPTLGVLVRDLKAAGGVQVTASHNPPAYNGLKLFSPQGRVISSNIGQQVLAAYRSVTAPWAAYDQLGTVEAVADPHGGHLRRLLSLVPVEAIRKQRFRVLLDSNAGSGSVLGRALLEALGCEVIVLGGEPDGHFLHPPEPTAENLASVAQRAANERIDVGFCQDPDADRLAILDERGRYLGEEYTLALCVDWVLRQQPGPVVANVATSRMVADLAQRYGVPFHRSKVGEANVVEVMEQVGAVIGGEGSGGPIDPRVGLVRDSFVGMAHVLAAMAVRGRKPSQLAAELPRYAMVKRTCPIAAGRLSDALRALKARFSSAEADEQDGLRLDWPDRWLIVRGSNTEPLVRLIAEATEHAAAEELVVQAEAVLRAAAEA
jgi:phosphomannomutase